MRDVVDIHQDLIEKSKKGNRVAQKAKGADPYGYRTEFILMAEKLKLLGTSD